MNTILEFDLETVQARQKATWEAGDFGQVAKSIEPAAEEFMAQLPLRPGLRVLDVACGTGNLAVIAAREGCVVHGLDLAENLVEQGRARARQAGFSIEFTLGDAEALPYPDDSFDAVVSMYGVMFTPRPEVAAAELVRVAKPGGLIAMANWTPTGFIGKMFQVFRKHLPPQPGPPSPLLWGDPKTVRERLEPYVSELKLTPRIARMCYPFSPAGTVEFFQKYYGPTQKAFAALAPDARAALRRDLEELQARHNVAPSPELTETHAEYMEIQARKIAIA